MNNKWETNPDNVVFCIPPKDIGVDNEEWLHVLRGYSPEQLDKRVFKHPSKFYYVNAMGNYIYILTNKRSKARKIVKECYGYEKYQVRKTQKAIV